MSDEAGPVREWVDGAKRGDPDALTALFDAYYDRVFRYALVRLSNVADAEDAASEVFSRMVTAIRSFRWRRTPFSSWLFGIARNVVVDQQRARGRRREDLRHELPEVAAAADGPEEDVMRDAERSGVREALDGLTAAQREALELRFGAELTSEQVGRVMGRSAVSVRILQMRGLRAMRQLVEEAT